jgi:glycosyltransferase involved in cell wall biosynthesis
LFEQIQSQEYQKFYILVVDNNSTDQSANMFGKWKKIYKNNFQFIKNEVNYGGHGSLFKNMNKIITPWFCTLHQDDFYKPNHISTLAELIKESKNNIVGVSTTMGSMSNKGKILNSKPRTTWFASNLDEAGQFLQNIRAQSVPYPASAFNLQVFRKTIVPFHSPTFSDTEQTLKMLGYGRFTVSQKETMYYRENFKSESHSLNLNERIIGAAVGLSRVFNSHEFDNVLNKISVNKRSLFAIQLVQAISQRIPESELLTTIRLIALERMVSKWGYNQKSIPYILGKNYAQIGSLISVSNINNLSNNKIRIKEQNHVQNKNTLGYKFWDLYYNFNFPCSKKLNRPLLKILYKLIFFKTPNHLMRSKWQ